MFAGRAIISDDKVTDVPNGKYKAIFSGWEISFFFNKEHTVRSSKVGIRGTAECIIEIEDGAVYGVPTEK